MPDAPAIRARGTLADNWYRLEKATFDQAGPDGVSQTLDREIYCIVEAGDDPAVTVRKEAEQELGYRLREVREAFSLSINLDHTWPWRGSWH